MNPLLQLIQDSVDTLNGDAFFNDPVESRRIVVITQNVGDIETEVQTKVANLGISVVAVMPLVKMPETLAGSVSLRVPLVFEVVENVTLNQGNGGTGKSILEVCWEIVCLLHGAGTGQGDPRNSRILATQNAITMVDTTPTYHANFTAPLTLTPRRAQPAPAAPQPNAA